MHKTIAILLLALFAAANTELGQMFKIPFMVQHFYTHQQLEGDSVSSFLLEHYQADHQDDDAAADEQLPFKSFNSQNLFNLFVPAVVFETTLPHVKILQNPFTLFDTHHLTQRSFAVFHPPRENKG